MRACASLNTAHLFVGIPLTRAWYVGVRVDGGCPHQVKHSPPYVLRQGLSLNLELINLARMAR